MLDSIVFWEDDVHDDKMSRQFNYFFIGSSHEDENWLYDNMLCIAVFAV